jgi:S1-C subfamily serine protease
MKLYSRRQLTGAIVTVSLLAAAAAFGLGYIAFRPQASQDSAGAWLGDQGSVQSAVTAESMPAPVDGAVAGTINDGTAATQSLQLGLPAASGQNYSLDERESISVYERYNESVVNITTEVVNINWFLEPVPESGGSGSGSIIDARGYVLTNYHVIEGAYKLFVNLADGSQYEATVVGTDPQNDLAVIKFEPKKGLELKPITLGSSKGLKVGQKVLAIGNPFGLERTLTQGIISGLGRPIQKDSRTVLQNMIQTDASINPGNSGGPLFNAIGQMIGINTMIYSTSGGSVGIGFAIPVDTAVRIVPELIKEGRVRRGWIDMEAIQLFPALVTYLSQSGQASPIDKGLLISELSEGSNAAKAGLQGGSQAVRYGRSTFRVGGDIIISVDGQAVGSIADLYTALEDNKPGEKVEVEFYRGSKKMKALIGLSEQSQER